ncbi:hypothetical protein CDL12_04594 [Handroanthus impetiginosus]|uniref:NLP1-9 GAF domain-containing protein n=1 Tax=Handroanthus impetiginosus TaxID=429701 RepID=A0A2G9HYW9_9LAMI|nr:hypothetical protein CDL12_04594 [Handroanthus impetiginosus]
MGERHDSSPTSRFEGWNELYSLDEFEELFNNYDKLSSKKYVRGFVFWTSARNRKKSSSSKAIQDQLRNLIEELAESTVTSSTYLLQIWVPKVVGGKRYLATSDQPFALGWRLSKGFSWYRKHCVDYKYFVGELGAKEEEIGPPGRVFRNEHPESSPDLLLYSNTEYPLRDYAVRCGATRYIALPLVSKLGNSTEGMVSSKTGLGSIHNGLTWEYKNIIYQQNPLASEFTEMLEMATGTFPHLHLAQVWVPCQHCSYTDNNRSCMRRTAFRLASGNNGICGFSDACEFHNEQSNKGIAGIVSLSANKSCFCRNLCDFNISQYPLAHYAQGARLSFCFAICFQSLYSSADLCIFEFFFHPDRREDAYTWYILRTLFQIMEKKLVSFKVASGRILGEEIAVEVGIRNNILASWELGFGQPNLSPCIQQKKHQNAREFTTIPTMAGYDKGFSLSDFLEYLQKPDLCCSLPSKDNSIYLFWTVGTKELQENGSNIRILLQDITTKSFRGQNFHGLVQFWALKEVKNRFYLSTSDQPFALTYLYKGLCWYWKQCMEHCYFVNEGVKEEELGPPGRFPLRDNAARCGLRRYLALPIFDLHKEQCIGVLEYMGFSCVDWDNEFGLIAAALEVFSPLMPLPSLSLLFVVFHKSDYKYYFNCCRQGI